jgi:hypothetical protein
MRDVVTWLNGFRHRFAAFHNTASVPTTGGAPS